MTNPNRNKDPFSQEQVTQSEGVHIPSEITNKIVDLAIDLVDQHKDTTTQLSIFKNLDRAKFYVGAHDVDEKVPTLMISVPKEEAQDAFSWRAELTFGNQDGNLSQHLLIKKDGTILLSSYNGSDDSIMTTEQAANFLTHFEEIQTSLIPDPDIA